MWLGLLGVLTVATIYFLTELGLPGMPPTFWKESLIFLTASFAVVFIYLQRARRETFLYLYLATMVIKLFVFAGYNIWIILKDKEQAPANVIFFLIVYLFFTAWELFVLFPRASR